MGYFKELFLKRNQSGQSAVEYILLMAMIASLFVTVFRSQAFSRFFGNNSGFFNAIAQRISLDYRYSTVIDAGDAISGAPLPNHPSFAQPNGSSSRFFGYNNTYVYPPKN